jgi:hypothetical protein
LLGVVGGGSLGNDPVRLTGGSTMAKRGAKTTRKTTRVRALEPRATTAVKGGEKVRVSEIAITKFTDA